MFFHDVRYALRGLWLSKGFATVAVLCLGFGIGLNTTIFSIVDGVLLKPFPYSDPERLVSIMMTNQKAGIGQANVSYLDLKDWKEASHAFQAIAGTQGRSFALSDSAGEPARCRRDRRPSNCYAPKSAFSISPVIALSPGCT